ncbi:Fanconi anemia group E protein [Trichomycterus rosablanca]|uniref:Fanconi anemia group E protein n=1 Tax=Trichomycterus rosablanca TaxID=2290929 RepID=UPI002F34F643
MKQLLDRFSGCSRLLVHSLLTGGVSSAQKVFTKLRAANSHSPLLSFLNTLCQDEACLDEYTHALTTKPLVCQFPAAFKCDLLCFLHLLHPRLPQDSVLSLLHCLRQETEQNPWASVLISQLRKDLEDVDLKEVTLLTPKCVLHLEGLCDRFKDRQDSGGWDLCLNEHETAKLFTDGERDSFQKKRKNENSDHHLNAETDGPQSKRRKTELVDQDETELVDQDETEGEEVAVDQEESDVVTLQTDKEQEGISPGSQLVSQKSSMSILPDHIKTAVHLIKELLESGTEWDESWTPSLKVLNECDLNQLEVLCAVLCLTEAPEQSLPHFCSGLLALSPDLSYSTACVIIKHLLLGKVLSLTEPASRCLVTAVTSLCNRYPRPTCQALIEPIIKEGHTGSAQAELLCRLIKDCLEPHHRLLVFQLTLVGSWNEGLLSVIHDLLDLKIELSDEDFMLFTNQLSSQSPLFTKSMKFSKMLLTVLTKFQSYVNAVCQHTLSCCISFNETFLKKSLQVALKRISH